MNHLLTILALLVSFVSCSNVGDTILFLGSNKQMTSIDTTKLYQSLEGIAKSEWAIISFPTPVLNTYGVWVKRIDSTGISDLHKIVLLFNGNDVSVWNGAVTAPCFRAIGADFMTIDFRGYGKTLGSFKPTEASCYEDAETAITHIKDSLHYSIHDIILTGFSLGTGIATEMATRYKTSALILFAPYSNVDNAVQGFTGQYDIPGDWFTPAKFDNLAKIDKVFQPCYIIAGSEDKMFPPSINGQILYDKATEPKSILIIPNKEHSGFIPKSCFYWKDSLATFIKTYCSP